jgi:hypothetical protein
MQIYIDLILGISSLIAAAYCLMLSKRLKALTRLDSELGTAIAIMSEQVETLTKVLRTASQSSTAAETTLTTTIARAEIITRNLELIISTQRALSNNDTYQNDLTEKINHRDTINANSTRVVRTSDARRGQRI